MLYISMMGMPECNMTDDNGKMIYKAKHLNMRTSFPSRWVYCLTLENILSESVGVLLAVNYRYCWLLTTRWITNNFRSANCHVSVVFTIKKVS